MGDYFSRRITVQIEIQLDHDRAAAIDDSQSSYGEPRLVDPMQSVIRTLVDILDYTTHRRDTVGRCVAQPDSNGLQSYCVSQRFPHLCFSSLGGNHPPPQLRV
ncbi:hypothetical protein KIH39_04665 [Telmatocola sphagniphila]|uniref:Uncharacterized protein n=1 Tax=Telmatocola sphagniphila TaxID=1123043 RepID=A0A8E6B9U3_9BACT|nr:hypothetical protein [Telmatocola sphagniphila]QVL33213.1 hypothetical protein KIH39_04665 [Telmatocola sphagniphila]